jgi:hypothetical protein
MSSCDISLPFLALNVNFCSGPMTSLGLDQEEAGLLMSHVCR